MTIPSDAVQKAETRTAEYWERPDGIVVQCLKADSKQSLADAHDNVATYESLCGGRKRSLLVDMRANFSTEAGVREFYGTAEAGRLVAAMGLLIASPFGRIMGNLYVTFTAPGFPMRIFTAEEEAHAWLRRMSKSSAQRR